VRTPDPDPHSSPDPDPRPSPVLLESADFRGLAERHGLTVSGARPTLGAYLTQIWGRRHFIAAFSRAKLTAQYSQARLGQVWQVATPLLNALVFYVVFGVLLQSNRGVPDYIPFLVTGVFVWTYTQSSVTAGVRAISGNLALVRALHFPRAALPLAFCLQQFQQLLFSMLVLVGVLLGFGLRPDGHWLLAVPALVLQSLFNAGLALAVARAGSRAPDLAQVLPFVLRTWMYLSGVMYSLADKAKHLPEAIAGLLPLNPAALYLDLMRFALVDSFHADRLPPHAWLMALGWALVTGCGGFLYFWTAEESYGRG
jgi:teichoic acid transport system permease protein